VTRSRPAPDRLPLLLAAALTFAAPHAAPAREEPEDVSLETGAGLVIGHCGAIGARWPPLELHLDHQAIAAVVPSTWPTDSFAFERHER